MAGAVRTFGVGRSFANSFFGAYIPIDVCAHRNTERKKQRGSRQREDRERFRQMCALIAADAVGVVTVTALNYRCQGIAAIEQ